MSEDNQRSAATIRQLFRRGAYKGFSMTDVLPRAGSTELLKNPSRVGATRFYPDGTNIRDLKE